MADKKKKKTLKEWFWGDPPKKTGTVSDIGLQEREKDVIKDIDEYYRNGHKKPKEKK